MRCMDYSCLRFLIVNQLHLVAVNIKEFHWLVYQPITPLPHYYTDCPITEWMSLCELSHYRYGTSDRTGCHGVTGLRSVGRSGVACSYSRLLTTHDLLASL